MPHTLRTILTLAVALVLATGVQFALAAWNGPVSSPPDGNRPAPINVSSTDQTKEGGLTVEGALWGSGIFSDAGGYFADMVGIGTTDAKAKLDVRGGIRPGNESLVTTCSAENDGTIRYNTVSNRIEFCTGDIWSALDVYTGCLYGGVEYKDAQSWEETTSCTYETSSSYSCNCSTSCSRGSCKRYERYVVERRRCLKQDWVGGSDDGYRRWYWGNCDRFGTRCVSYGQNCNTSCSTCTRTNTKTGTKSRTNTCSNGTVQLGEYGGCK